ncbi:hypothetical protein [Capnocytophaga bilenii]
MIKTLIVSFLGVSSVRAAQAFYPSVRAAQAFYPSVRAARASHTRLCQLADFPSLEQKINKGCTMGFISYLCG